MADGGPTPLERFYNGIIPENPTFRQILGICPTLAVTNTVRGALTMAAAVAFVLIGSNLVISLIRKRLKPHLRILVFTLVIAVFVTIADRLLAAFLPAMSRLLGPYVPLIIVNCIILARAEICASRQGVGTALADASGQSIGHAMGLVGIAGVREVLGTGWFLAGTPLAVRVLPASWPNWNVMVLPPGAFLTLGVLLGAVNWVGAARKARATRKAALAGEPS